MPLIKPSKATLKQLPGGWWLAKELGGFQRGECAETASLAWFGLYGQGVTIVPADEETRLWAVDAKWNTDRERGDVGGKRFAAPHVRRLVEQRVFGKELR